MNDLNVIWVDTPNKALIVVALRQLDCCASGLLRLLRNFTAKVSSAHKFNN